MGYKYGRGFGLRSWVRGEFRTVNFPIPPESEAMFPRSQWGMLSAVRLADAPFLRISIVALPDGVLVATNCGGCGGRSETLLDRRRMGVDGIFRAPLINAPVDAARVWAESHRSCSDSPRPLLASAEVQRFADVIARIAESAVTRGKAAPAFVHVLCTNGEGFVYPVHDLPDRSAGDCERRILLAERQWAVRRFIDEQRLDVRALVVCSEMWRSTKPNTFAALDPDRVEILNIMTLTPDHAASRSAPIERLGGVIDSGPGRLGAWETTNSIGGELGQGLTG